MTKRTLLFFIVPLTVLVAALLLRLPAYSIDGRIGPSHVEPSHAVPVADPVVTASNGSLSLRARPSRHAFLAGGDDLSVVYDITAARPASETRRPVDFALVLDRSGSMTGEPLDKAKEAAEALVGRLSAADRLAIVHYGSDVHLALALTPMNEAGRAQALVAVRSIEAEGGTNTSSALVEAERVLMEASPREAAIRRVVLLSDGEANEGLVGNELVELVREEGSRGLRVSALGLGLDFDEELMMNIADAGGGQYRYLRNADEVASALTTELSEASGTAATSISLALTPSDGVELRASPGVTPEIAGHVWRIHVNDMAAGETRHVTVAVHASGAAVGPQGLVEARLTYEDVPAGHLKRAAEAIASAEATHDASAVAQSYDKDAARIALRARWGSTMMNTARQYRQREVAGASRGVEDAVITLGNEARAMGDGDLAKEISDEGGQALHTMSAAPPVSAAGGAFLKSFATAGRAATR